MNRQGWPRIVFASLVPTHVDRSALEYRGVPHVTRMAAAQGGNLPAIWHWLPSPTGLTSRSFRRVPSEEKIALALVSCQSGTSPAASATQKERLEDRRTSETGNVKFIDAFRTGHPAKTFRHSLGHNSEDPSSRDSKTGCDLCGGGATLPDYEMADRCDPSAGKVMWSSGSRRTKRHLVTIPCDGMQS